MAGSRHVDTAQDSQVIFTDWLYPIKLARGHIRLLSLHIDDSDHTIRCSLTTKPLSPDLEYYALSYAWNGNIKERSILVDRLWLDVTQSAFDALTSIRTIFRRNDLRNLPIWMDAICINQDDVAERNEQVDQMGRIYRTANVLVYLGPEAAESGNELRIVTDPGVVDRTAVSPGPHASFQQRTEAAVQMFSRPWFSRIWVVQEAVLGKSTMVICGSYMCQFAELYGALRELNSQSDGSLSRTERFREILDAVALIRRLSLKRSQGDNEGITREYSTARVLQCADPRDHCFGLHGMHPDSDSALPLVDYSNSVALVFTIAAHWVTNQCGFHALSMEHADISREESDPPLVPGLPSWVPDWTMRGTPRYYPWWMYRAGGTDPLQYKSEMFSNDNKNLSLQGFVVDTVISKCPIPDLKPHLTGVDSFATVESRIFPARGSPKYETAAARLLAVQRTICIDLAYKYDMDATTGYIWTRWNHRPGFADIAAQCFEGSLDPSAIEYTATLEPRDTDVVLTFEQGHIGLGREHVQPGDLAVIFPGVRVPFILRRRTNNTMYQMIGPTYLDGMMDGDAMVRLARGEYSLQSFEMD